jgi:periplasmic protein TonB
MLTVLLESRAARPRRLGSTVLSALAHGAVIAVVVALTLPGRGSARPGPTPHFDTLIFVSPAEPDPVTRSRSARSPARDDVDPTRPTLPTIAVPVITPGEIPPIDLSLPTMTSDQVRIGNRSAPLGGGVVEPGGPLRGVGDVRDAATVDRAPRLTGRALEPRYPPVLRDAGIEGHVLAEFVVDTLGRAELATLRFPELSNALFGDAVREAITRYRFTPGEMAGRKVRTRVAVPFEFRLRR